MSSSVPKWYGCMFCISGHEQRGAQLVEMRWPGLKARAVSAYKRRSRGGVKSLQLEVVMPGYIFYEAEGDFRPEVPFPEGVLKALKTVDGSWKLMGRDEEFARWLLEKDGQIGVSKAHHVGEKVRIYQGPLKDLEGFVLRIDQRNQNAQIGLEVEGRTIKVWLPFEIVEDEVSLAIDEE